jgi:hypothetical protein
MRHQYDQPVNVTFRFNGLSPKPGQTFYLWGDFFGDPDFTVFPVPYKDGELIYQTTIPPGTFIRFQLFGDKAMKKPLIVGQKLDEGAVSKTVPNNDTVYTFDLNRPAP